jgi:hypothetical protein
LGRMRKAAYNRLGKKQTVKDVMIMNSSRSNPGLELANAFGVQTASVLLQKGVAPNQANCFRT